jgi:hypothetical protein
MIHHRVHKIQPFDSTLTADYQYPGSVHAAHNLKPCSSMTHDNINPPMKFPDKNI